MKRSLLGGITVLVIAIFAVWFMRLNPVTINGDTQSRIEWVIENYHIVQDKANELFDKFEKDILGISDARSDIDKVYAASGEFIEAEMVSVVDGDTIWVKINSEKKKIRFLTINTEESVHSDTSKNNIYGKKASKLTKKLLKGHDTVWLQYDEEPQDIYGRELCYVWLTPDVDTGSKKDVKKYMLNAILLKKGYAYTTVYEPNTTYAKLFYKIEKSARKNKKGLWKYDEFVKLANEHQGK